MAPETTDPSSSQLMQVSRALMRVYKDNLGRGPDRAYAHYAGPDAIVCFLEGRSRPSSGRSRRSQRTSGCGRRAA